MDARIARNRGFLADLFAGPFRGHAIIVDPEAIPAPWPGDYACSGPSPEAWLPWLTECYQAKLRWLDALDDDAVPTVRLNTGTYLFAAAFGCAVHLYPENPAAARPLVTTAEEADRLVQPDVYAPPLDRFFRMAERVRERLGPEAPISVPDIQSAFDIAALIWNKQDLYVATLDNPAAVQRLVAKCQALLKAFLAEFRRQFPQANLCHCPNAWAPPELGAWLSEDEIGAMSTRMFSTFILPQLVDLSESFGGLFVHCCATADHQYQGFQQIPNLRGLNRVFQYPPGFGPAIRTFAGQTVLIQAWMPEEDLYPMLDMAQPDSRFLFNLSGLKLEEAKVVYARLRARCPRK